MASTHTPEESLQAHAPAQPWLQPMGWWRARGASNNALRLATGCDPQEALEPDLDAEGYTLWHYWAEGDQAHTRLKTLLECQPLVDADYRNQRATDGEHPFHRLMLRGQIEAAKAWHDLFGPVDLTLKNAHGDDMLLAACWSGNTELVQWILSLNDEADTSHSDGQGLTALMVALHRCGPDIAIELVQAGFDPDARDRQQKNSLHHAAALAMVDIFPFLEDAGADADSQDATCVTASSALARTLRSEAISVEATRMHWHRRYLARIAF